MTSEEFREATATLEGCYNKKLNNIQAQVWFDELKYYTVEKYNNAIKKLITSQQYFPALSTVLDAIRNARQVVDLTQKTTVDCKACHGTGYVMYYQVFNNIKYQYACLCNCENAEGKAYDGRFIADKEHRTMYYTPNGEDVFHININKASEVEPIDFDVSQINF